MDEKREKSDGTTHRKPRADAERNRARVLETAKATFAAKGAGASLEEIARTAGVGIGTLYRHFPTRDALVEAVYRNETQQLADAAKSLTSADGSPSADDPVGALRTWMLLFVDYIATKNGMSESLGALVGGTSELYASSGEQITTGVRSLFDRAVAAGQVRGDVDPVDLLRALVGVSSAGCAADWETGARKLVDILLAGIRSPR